MEQIKEYLQSGDIDTVMVGFRLLQEVEGQEVYTLLKELGFICPGEEIGWRMWYLREKNEFGTMGYTQIGEL